MIIENTIMSGRMQVLSSHLGAIFLCVQINGLEYLLKLPWLSCGPR